MFTNFICLILAILIIVLSPSAANPFITTQEAFVIGFGSYLLVLALIIIQNTIARKYRKSNLLLLANLELLLFLAFFHSVLGIPHILSLISESLAIFSSLFLYFLGLWVHHVTASRHTSSRYSKAFHEITLMIPFILPFLIITGIVEILELLPIPAVHEWLYHGTETFTGNLIFIAVNIIVLLLIMVFLPYLVQIVWRCKPIQDNELKKRLEALCTRAHFKHAVLKIWTVLNHSLTAAIIGVVAPYRYVMFTQRMLNEMPPEMVEAVLAHEIGHHYRRHLLIYPFIIFGMSLLLLLFGIYAAPILHEEWITMAHHYPWKYWRVLYPLFMIIPFLAIAALYLRYAFGFFSRLFERQADLHVFILDVPAEHLIEALNYIGIATGHSHHQPNWHHHSIQQRIDFLKAAMGDHRLIKKHHDRVKTALVFYFIAASMLAAWLLN